MCISQDECGRGTHGGTCESMEQGSGRAGDERPRRQHDARGHSGDVGISVAMIESQLCYISCVTMSWGLNFSELQLSHLYNKDDDSYLVG